MPEVLDKLKGAFRSSETPVAVPPVVDERLKRGRDVKGRDASMRKLCWHMWRGNQYAYLNEKNTLVFQDTVTHATGGGKPRHRVRQVRNLIRPIVEDKVSNATRRTPAYEVAASTSDPEDFAAASLARKVAFAGYDKWMVRRARVKVVTNAVVSQSGFAMPYFDPNVGPFVKVLDGESGEERLVGHGEIKVLCLSRDEVMWEEGCDFYESPWHAIERARPIDDVTAIPGYMGGKLTPDANTADNPTDRKGDHLVLVTEFFERPCRNYPDGRKLTIANKRLICPVEPYPCRDPDGNIVDEPVIHMLSYTVDPERDDDHGLVEALIDPQRTINDCVNKELEWKNRCLNPRMLARKGSLVTRPDDVPGGVDYYVGNEKPEWENPPSVPRELADIADRAWQHMQVISANADVQAEADVAARTVQAVMEKASSQWAAFLQDLAEFDSRLMRHCLYLAARHYSEDRLMKVRGRVGWEPIPMFKGADLRGQCDVTVLPGSLEPKTRQAVRDEVDFMATRFPGWLKPEVAFAAIQGGPAEDLIRSYELDAYKAHKTVQLLASGPDAAMALPDRLEMTGTDPLTGQPMMQQVPGWMPRRTTTNTAVWRAVVRDYCNTDEFDRLPPETQEMFELLLDGLDHIDVVNAVRQQQLQMEAAARMGLANAGDPSLNPAGGQPSPPALESGGPPMDGPPPGQPA